MEKRPAALPEPWLRGTWTELPAIARGALHALELAWEDLQRWARQLSDEQLNLRVHGLASVAFQIRHIAGSVDRLLSYAEGKQLNKQQQEALRSEHKPAATREELFAGLHAALKQAKQRIVALAIEDLEAARFVGRKSLPSSFGGLLVHVADHTQRHVGQAVVTAKIVLAEANAVDAAK